MVKAGAGGASSSTGIQLAKRVLADQVIMLVYFPLELWSVKMADRKGRHLV